MTLSLRTLQKISRNLYWSWFQSRRRSRLPSEDAKEDAQWSREVETDEDDQNLEAAQLIGGADEAALDLRRAHRLHGRDPDLEGGRIIEDRDHARRCSFMLSFVLIIILETRTPWTILLFKLLLFIFELQITITWSRQQGSFQVRATLFVSSQ